MKRQGCVPGFGNVFSQIWNLGQDLTAELLEAYAQEFSAINRSRDPAVMAALGLSVAEDVESISLPMLRNRTRPREPSVDHTYASAAWAGLQSYTGEYRFQLEFPRKAGEVIRRIVAEVQRPGDLVPVRCENGSVLPMRYAFYPNNSMFRLNIPNTVPRVDWARDNRNGIVLVERSTQPGAVVELRIIPPGPALGEVVKRSYALGTWGKTPTRSYGWY